MKEILISTVLLVVGVLYFHTPSQESKGEEYDAFILWCAHYSKSYHSQEESLYRFNTFKTNYALIQNSNNYGSSVVYGVNQYMDLEYEEFKMLMMSGHVERSHKFEGLSENAGKIKYLNLTNLPESVDWRGIATPKIKDQGRCGACWAFSTVGALEGAYAVKNGLVELSEQQVVDCCRINLYGCNGGDPIVALDECLLRDGIMSAADYPYTGIASRYCAIDDNKLVYTPTDYVIVPHNNSEQLKMAVSQQPVSVCVSDSAAFHFYKSGILDSITCGEYIDHCILLVGYGVENDIEYWLLKNSWGEEWGDQGYLKIRIQRGISPGICGVQMEGSYVIV